MQLRSLGVVAASLVLSNVAAAEVPADAPASKAPASDTATPADATTAASAAQLAPPSAIPPSAAPGLPWQPSPRFTAPVVDAPIPMTEKSTIGAPGRVVLSLLLGAATGTLGAIAGGIVGASLGDDGQGGFSSLHGLVDHVLIGGTIAIPFATTVGVLAGGMERGYDASVGVTLLGASIGTGVGVAVATQLDNLGVGVIVTLAASTVGATLAHRVSRTKSTSTEIRVVPMTTRDSVGVSLVGTL